MTIRLFVDASAAADGGQCVVQGHHYQVKSERQFVISSENSLAVKNKPIDS